MGGTNQKMQNWLENMQDVTKNHELSRFAMNGRGLDLNRSVLHLKGFITCFRLRFMVELYTWGVNQVENLSETSTSWAKPKHMSTRLSWRDFNSRVARESTYDL